MEFEVLKAGRVLVPNFGLLNEEGVLVFIAHDCDPAWRGRPREVGRYVSTAWVPGNFLAEGCLTVDVAVSEHNPVVIHLHHPASVAFQVVDSLDGDSARGDYAGHMPGVVRPLLRWDTRFESNGAHSDVGGIPRNRSTPAGPY
jgi:lipopolysaccharide transport system ATP-binding protein